MHPQDIFLNERLYFKILTQDTRLSVKQLGSLRLTGNTVKP